MGRQRPAWYYERQAREATARENYFKNRTPTTEDTTIESRGPQTEVYYRSMIMMDATDHLIYVTQVSNRALQAVTAAEAGLKTTLGENEVASRLRGSGIKPTRIHWYRGSANPVRRSTPWGTKVARYYAEQNGRSHFSMPFSRHTGQFNADDLKDAFTDLFGPGGSKRALLGDSNGRAYISWETVSVSANT
jgi:hypothetical protein